MTIEHLDLHGAGVSRVFVQLTPATFYLAPYSAPLEGPYDLHPFAPTAPLADTIPFEVMEAVPAGIAPTKVQCKGSGVLMPSLYVVRSKSRVQCFGTALASFNPARYDHTVLQRIVPQDMRTHGMHFNLLFRCPHFVIHHLTGHMFSMSVTDVGENLHRALTVI